MAIRSFASRQVERFFVAGQLSRRAGWAHGARIARRTLDVLDYAEALSDYH